MKQSDASIELESKFVSYIRRHEFFWLADVKKEFNIVEQKAGQTTGSDYHRFGWLIRKMKREQKIQPCDSKGNEKQYQSLIFEG